MDVQSNLIITHKPKLRQPSMVCGIGGWVDGGEAATGSIEYLVKKLRAKKFAQIALNKFHIFQVPGQLSLRPEVRMEEGLLREHRFPRNQFFYAINPNTDNDLILFLGTEPNLNWQEYADTIVSVAEEFGVIRVYTLGGVLDRTPHTREPGVSCSCSSSQLKEEMRKYVIGFSNYRGPGSFGTTLLHVCQGKKMPMVGFITRSTYYPEYNIVIPRNPRSIRALMVRLNALLHLGLDISDLDRESEELEAKLGLMASQNPEFKNYVAELEKDYFEVGYEEPLNLSANEAVEIAEEFLKGEGKD
ncbi:PAC2 family protein [Chloroflexota bacterium]